MIKFKCEKCDHEASEKGFCPKDGAELKEVEVKGGNDLNALLEKIGVMVKDQTETTMKEYGLDKVDNKKIFPSGSKMPSNRAEKHEYVKGLLSDKDQMHFDGVVGEKEEKKFLSIASIAYFFKSLVSYQISKDPKHLEHAKALASGVDAAGGYMVPPEFRAQLIEDLQDKAFLRGLVTVIPMNTNSLEIPTLTSSVQVSWGSENTSITTTTARFGTLTFTPYRLNSLMYTSRELVADSAINVVQLITRLFNEAMGREEDSVIINGDGSGKPKGILQETLSGIDNENSDSGLPDSLKKLPYRLGKAYRARAQWLVNSKSLEHIATLKDGDSRYLFNAFNGGIVQKDGNVLAGYPVSEQNDMPIDTLLFGDMSQYFLADREQISVETTTEGAGTFEKHQVAIKITERIDGKVAQTNAFRLITNAGID